MARRRRRRRLHGFGYHRRRGGHRCRPGYHLKKRGRGKGTKCVRSK